MTNFEKIKAKSIEDMAVAVIYKELPEGIEDGEE